MRPNTSVNSSNNLLQDQEFNEVRSEQLVNVRAGSNSEINTLSSVFESASTFSSILSVPTPASLPLSRAINATDRTDETTSIIINSFPAAIPTTLQGLEHLLNVEVDYALNENNGSNLDDLTLFDNQHYELNQTNSISNADESHAVLINQGQQLTRKKRTRRLEALAELESNPTLNIIYEIFIKYIQSQVGVFSLASRLHSLQVNESITLSALLKPITSNNRPNREALVQMISELSESNLFNITHSKANIPHIRKSNNYPSFE